MFASKLRVRLMLGILLAVLTNIVAGSYLPVSDLAATKTINQRDIPVNCGPAHTTIPQTTVSGLVHYLCSGLVNQTDPNAGHNGSPVQAGKMVSQNLITDWANHVLLSFFYNNTCSFQFIVNQDVCELEMNTVVDQCSSDGEFYNGTTFYGCNQYSAWTYLIV